jgi:hypothetical protein
LKSVAVFELGAVFREAYNTGTLQFWYLAIDILCLLFYVEFDDGLSSMILKNRATCLKISQLEIVKALKKSKVFKPRPPTFFHTLPFSNARVRIYQWIKTWCI